MNSNFFSQPNLGGVNEGDFEKALRYVNLKQQFLQHIQEEIEYLEKCVHTSNTGGWSTHLNDGMKSRINQIKALYFDLIKAV